MTPDRWRQVDALYHEALDLPPANQRLLLDQADSEVAGEVESLLAQNGSLPDRPAWQGANGTESATLTVVSTGTSSVPDELGPYKIERQIGSGGMGTVYSAVDTRLGREVAIKIAAARYSERFQLEVQAISKLNHPHVCTLYDVGPNYLVMELIDGSTLAAEIKKGPLAPEMVARCGAQIAGALAEAHSRGIVHRDLKPANIMLTRHGVKVLDFGLARMLSETGITETNLVMGTPAYMAPEQVEGREPTSGTDLFALGIILYEMSTGRLPIPGASLGRMLTSGSQTKAPSLSQQGADVPRGLDALVARLLEKNPAERYQSASQVADELSALEDELAAPSVPGVRSALRPLFLIPAILSILVLAGLGIWQYRSSEKRHWVREQAIPEIGRLSSQTPLAAFLLLEKAQKYLPGDAQLASIAKSLTRRVSVQSSPPGATVEIQDYLAPNGPWLTLGAAPRSGVLIPSGYFRWRVSKPGAGQLLIAPETRDTMQFQLAAAGTAAGMVHVPAGRFSNMIDFLGWLQYPLPAYDIDQFEVTNRQYQQFVDQGGYRKRDFWKQKFIKDGKEIAWDQAMELFRDPTGRAGPATWEGGHFPEGKAEYPVSGVSWYEAAAYAEFSGKSLPTLAQWYKAAPSDDRVRYTINTSNFGGRGPWRVGTSPNVGPYGTYDMGGNVREWCFNTVDTDERFILGGGWRTQTYQAVDPEALLPMDRSELNGFRCVRNKEPLPAEVTGPLVRWARDFSKAKPASDEVFQAYQTMYAYDRTPLAAQKEGIVEITADWTKEKISIDAGYGNERLPLYLFLPKNVNPPFQTVVFFPSARVDFMPSSRNLGDLQFVDYVIKSGRALAYPIYKGTYERSAHRPHVGAIGDLDLIVEESKEVRRSIDYLETRSDIDKSKLAYLGVSQGTAYGVIFTALEDRFKTVIFLDGGFFLNDALPARDQVNFAPRLKKPVLMVNGRYDFTFSVDRAQDPLFRMLGAPAAEKRHVVFDTPHDISQQKADLSREVLAWLDKYLGRVN
jgi:eukaryotic-like serine/threonine-protein kinase